MDNGLFDYHIKETNKRLERIETKLDDLMEAKSRFNSQSKNMAVAVSMFVSLLVAGASELFKRIFG